MEWLGGVEEPEHALKPQSQEFLWMLKKRRMEYDPRYIFEQEIVE